MAKYNITQKVNLNGVAKSSSFQVDLEPAEVTALLALMEGGVSVTKQDDTLTDMTGAETAVTAYNGVSRISMGATDAAGNYVSLTIKPFKGSLVFKNTASVDDIKAVFATATPFALAPTLKPSRISVLAFDEIAQP